MIALEKGQRVVLRRDVVRYPHFTAKAGLRGTVTGVRLDLPQGYTDRGVIVHLDQEIAGCAEWGNCIQWDGTTLLELDGDLALEEDVALTGPRRWQPPTHEREPVNIDPAVRVELAGLLQHPEMRAVGYSEFIRRALAAARLELER